MEWINNAIGFLIKGGPVMAPLMICSIVSLAVMIERYLSIGRAKGDSRRLFEQVEKHVRMGKYTDAARACENHGTALGKMLAAGLRCPDGRQAQGCMEEEALKASTDLHKRLSSLDTIITIAPLLGLLGTVTGMIRAFHVISSQSGLGTPTAITGGVAEALIATATGLAIAIATVIGYNNLIERAKGVVSDMEIYGTRLVNIMPQEQEYGHETQALGA